MIQNREEKIKNITKVIETRINEINNKDRYRQGPELFFYKKLISLRTKTKNISHFLKAQYNYEIMYATIVAWDMNSGGTKMKYFTDFKNNLSLCKNELIEMEKLKPDAYTRIKELLITIYFKLNIMETEGKFAGNAKILHFLFPNLLMPMDKINTLNYFYGNTRESEVKYVEIIELSFEIMKRNIQWKKYLDDKWNLTVPKIIDNAVIIQSK